jgi:hypothetical protein
VLTRANELSQYNSDRCSYRAREYVTDEGPWDPITGAASALTGTATSLMMGVADMPIETLKLLNIHPDMRSSKKGKERAGNADGNSNEGPNVAGRSNSAMSGNSTPTALQSPELGAGDSKNPEMVHSTTPGTSSHRSEPNDRNKPDTPTVPRTGTSSSSQFSNNLKNMQVESAVDTGKGLARIVGAGFRSPMDFSLNVAKGLHNVPKLYGGEVRQVEKVTDLKSGLSTAAKVSLHPNCLCVI